MIKALGRSPVEAAFGFDQTYFDGMTRLTQPWSPHLSDHESEGLDRGVIVLLVDHAMGHNLGRKTLTPSPCTTLNLRFDWLTSLPDRTGVVVIPEVVAFDGIIGTTRAEVWTIGNEQMVALAHGSFLVGVFPGGMKQGEAEAPLPPLPPRPVEQFPNFRAFLGMEPAEGEFILSPSPDFVGMRRIGAFHGGVIGAFASQASRSIISEWAAGQKVRHVSLEIRYLKPNFAQNALRCRPSPLQMGRRVCTVTATLWQGGEDGRPSVQTVTTCIKEAG